MEISRETVNKWLDQGPADRDRGWLAQRCGVKVSAVGNWLNKKGEARPIPAEHQIRIRRLMEEDEAKKQAKPPQNLVLEFSDEEFTAIERAAHNDDLTVREWARKELNSAAYINVSKFAAEILSNRREHRQPASVPDPDPRFTSQLNEESKSKV